MVSAVNINIEENELVRRTAIFRARRWRRVLPIDRLLEGARRSREAVSSRRSLRACASFAAVFAEYDRRRGEQLIGGVHEPYNCSKVCYMRHRQQLVSYT